MFSCIQSKRIFSVAFLFVSGLVGLSTVTSMEEVVFSRDGVERVLKGEVVVEAQDGGMMLRATDGRIWMIQPNEIKSNNSTT